MLVVVVEVVVDRGLCMRGVIIICHVRPRADGLPQRHTAQDDQSGAGDAQYRDVRGLDEVQGGARHDQADADATQREQQGPLCATIHQRSSPFGSVTIMAAAVPSPRRCHLSAPKPPCRRPWRTAARR